MIEYRLEATGDPVFVVDLKLRVTREVVWVSRSDLEASDCLRVLIRLGKIRVSSGARSRVSKLPPPPKRRLPSAVARSRPGGKGVAATPATAPVTQGVTPEEAQAMANKAAQTAAENAVKMAVAALLPAIRAIQQNPAPAAASDLDLRIEQAVARALGSVSFTGPATSSLKPTTGPDEPLFIPTGIVKDTVESLTIKSDSSKSEDLDGAASALKALRKGKGMSKK